MLLRHRCIQHLCVVALTFVGTASIAAAELGPEGLWKTTDDHTGKPRGMVRIYQANGALYGRVESTLDPAEARQVCDLCTDERRNKPVVGMIVMRGLRKNGGEYNGGDILDPDTGSVYRCKFRIEDQGRKLIVRGFIGFSLFGRTQTWTRQP